jgi:hypothetical protein
MRNTSVLLIVLVASATCGCSSAFWHTQIQGDQYDKCEKLTSPEDRRRCKAETYPDHDKYTKDQSKTKG